jgi:hypothetical protein
MRVSVWFLIRFNLPVCFRIEVLIALRGLRDVAFQERLGLFAKDL